MSYASHLLKDLLINSLHHSTVKVTSRIFYFKSLNSGFVSSTNEASTVVAGLYKNRLWCNGVKQSFHSSHILLLEKIQVMTTVVFVHGTGVRNPGYEETISQVSMIELSALPQRTYGLVIGIESY